MRGFSIGLSTLVVALGICLRAGAHEVVPPRPLHQPAPEWPAGYAAEHDVLVPLVLVVDAEGNVTAARVEVGLDPALDQAALAAAKTWKFEPARGDGGPIAARVRAVARFRGRRVAADEATGAAEPAQPAPVRIIGHGQEEEHSLESHALEVQVHGPPVGGSPSELVRGRRVLEAAPHRTASDLLQTVPGVFVTQHSGEGKAHQIFFRGFDAAHGQDMEIWVAGAPVNEVSHVHGQGYADLHFVMPEVVQRLRALPGPYRPEQGDFAVAGTLAFDLGYAEPGATVSGSVGSFETRRAFFAYHPEGAPEQTFAAAELYATDGFGAGREAQRASAIGQWLLPLSHHTTLRLMGGVFASRFGSAGVLRLDDIEAGRVDRFGSYDLDQGGRSTRAQLVFDLVTEHEHYQLGFAPYLVRRSLDLRSNYTGALLHPDGSDRVLQTNSGATVGFRTWFRRRLGLFGAHDSIELGLFGRVDEIEQTQRQGGTEGDVVRDVDARVSAVDAGAYAEVVLRPLDRWLLRAGARLDGLSYAVRDAPEQGGASRAAQTLIAGEKLGTAYAISPQLSALLSYGRGFRSPQARGLSDGGDVPVTRVQSVELGLRFAEERRLRASIAAFRTTLSDDLAFDETSARFEPVPATLRLGGVAEVTATPTSWFTSALGATFTRATFRQGSGEIESGSLVPYVPQWIVRSDVSARPALGRVGGLPLRGFAGAGVSYLVGRPLPFGETGSGIFLMDARLGVRVPAAEIELRGYNLLGAEWYDSEFVYASRFDTGGSLLPVRHVTAGAPRTLLLSLTLHI